MLKLIYTDTGVVLEQLTQPLHEWLQMRLTFAQSVGAPLQTELSHGSVLLMADQLDLSWMTHLEVDRCDAETWEICLAGIWLATSACAHEGILAVELDPQLEEQILYLWQQTQNPVESLLPLPVEGTG